jgi:hypothetical protein
MIEMTFVVCRLYVVAEVAKTATILFNLSIKLTSQSEVKGKELSKRRTEVLEKNVRNCKNKPRRVRAGVYPPVYPFSA